VTKRIHRARIVSAIWLFELVYLPHTTKMGNSIYSSYYSSSSSSSTVGGESMLVVNLYQILSINWLLLLYVAVQMV
jgi:hypothetical protein